LNFILNLKHEKAFSIPHSVIYDSDYGCNLVADAIAGARILSTKINQNQECKILLHIKKSRIKFNIYMDN
jgi:hypothetical protein